MHLNASIFRKIEKKTQHIRCQPEETSLRSENLLCCKLCLWKLDIFVAKIDIRWFWPILDAHFKEFSSLFAVKLLDWEDGTKTAAEAAEIRASFKQEVAVWHKLNHPNVTSVNIETFLVLKTLYIQCFTNSSLKLFLLYSSLVHQWGLHSWKFLQKIHPKVIQTSLQGRVVFSSNSSQAAIWRTTYIRIERGSFPLKPWSN